jgi:hypothetical protein
MRRLAAIALVAVACGAVTAHAQALSLAYAKGATYHYTLHMTSNLSTAVGVSSAPVKMDMTAKEAVTVNSVDSMGVADISLTFSDVHMVMSMTSVGSSTKIDQTQSTFPTVDLKIAPDGRVVSVNGINVMSEMALGVGGASSFVIAVLPDNAVKPNDSWSKSYDQPSPFGSGAIHVTANSKYLRNETFHGVQAAVVETTTSANIDLSMTPTQQGAAGGFPGTSIKGKWTTDVTSWIDPSAHRLMKTLMKGSDDITMTIDIQPGPPVTSPDGSPTMPPGMTGPFTLKGTQTLDLEPA